MSCETDNLSMEKNTEVINKKTSRKKVFKFILNLIQVIIIPTITVLIIIKTNTLTSTANMLQLNNAIQAKTDLVYNIELKRNEIKIAKINGDIINDAQEEQLFNEKRNAITALLNTYEFACQHYLDNKIDKKAFETFYKVMIKYIREEYNDFFIYIDGRDTYSAINEVYRKWQIK